tara:strand:- start:1450 stop:2799 length:1350 start_codon:yes stop_codon:yes gene_type:complete
MPAKKKLTKKKPAAKAAQPSSKKRPMPTKAKPAAKKPMAKRPAAKKAAPKAKAKPMAKKKKPAAKKPARRPFHEGGMIDMELDMLESMAGEAMMAARDSNNPEALDRIFRDLTMGIDQVRMVNEREMERGKQPRPNPNVPQFKLTPEQEQGVRAMNQARFSGPQFPRRTTNPEPILPKDPPFKKDMPGYDPNAPAPPRKPTDTSGPVIDGPRDLSGLTDKINRINKKEADKTRARQYSSNPNLFTYLTNLNKPPQGLPSIPKRPPTRVPFNQPPMDRRPPRGAPDLRPNPQGPVNTTDRYLPTSSRFGPQIPNPNYVNTTDRFIQESGRFGPQIPNPNYVNTTDQYLPNTGTGFRNSVGGTPNPNYRPPVPNYNSPRGRRTLEQTNRAVNQARFTRPQVTPQMQAAARQMQQGTNAGTTPRPMNKGGMVLTPEQYQRAAALTRPKNKRR